MDKPELQALSRAITDVGVAMQGLKGPITGLKASMVIVDDALEDLLPSYSDQGFISLIFYGKAPPYDNGKSSVYQWSFDILDYDGCSCCFWIMEGEGWDYWLDQADFYHKKPGVYVIDDIVGHYTYGDGYTSDDDVDWDHAEPRRARWSDCDKYMPFNAPWFIRWWTFLIDHDPLIPMWYARRHL